MTKEKQAALAAIDQNAALISHVADEIWKYAELSLQEFQSSALYCKTLRDCGFNVKEGICSIPTAFSASFGSGRPVIGTRGIRCTVRTFSESRKRKA
jgi:aminobenzoyl-glutamate utilization protein B